MARETGTAEITSLGWRIAGIPRWYPALQLFSSSGPVDVSIEARRIARSKSPLYRLEQTVDGWWPGDELNAARCRSNRWKRMWEAREQVIPSGVRYEVFEEDSQLSFRELFALLEGSPTFALWYSEALAASPFAAFFWEHPPLSIERFDHKAEFVLIESASLAALEPDPAAFREKFVDQPEPDVIAFSNLNGDARLVVPRPLGRIEAYPHLATFLRIAPERQVVALWKATGQVLRETLGSRLTWLSTAGLGVPWLHLRFDTRPKYYSYRPYQSAPETQGKRSSHGALAE